MFTINEPLIHRFDIALRAVEEVQNGNAPFYTQYLLKPDLNIKEDIRTATILFGIICIVRLIVSGIHRKSWKNFPCLARLLFQKIVIPAKSLKFHENFWYYIVFCYIFFCITFFFSSRYTCWHTCSFLFGLYVLIDEAMTEDNPGWTRMLVKGFDSKWFWFPTPAEIVIKHNSGWPYLIMSPLVRLYYITEFSFWTSCAIFLWFETYRSDFYALLLHHGITSALLLGSYTLSFWRIGCVILVTHDIADIFLYLVKCLFYMTKFSYLISPMFLLFTFVFFVSRLIFFPFFCLKPALDTRMWGDWTQRVVTSHWQIPGGLMLPACLSMLQVRIFFFLIYSCLKDLLTFCYEESFFFFNTNFDLL
jgi:hypothetical protein